MKYEVTDKFLIDGVDLTIEIVGRLPGAQGVKIDAGGENYYRIIINGLSAYMPEQLLDLFIEFKNNKRIVIEDESDKDLNNSYIEEDKNIVKKNKKGAKK